MLRACVAFALSAGCLAKVLACGDGDAPDTGSSTSSSTSSGGGDASSDSGFKTCSGTRPSGGASRCTGAELEAYADCERTQCEAKYEECYGPDYERGSFTGACGTFIACTQKCACGDTSCYVGCRQDSACSTCSQGFATCAQRCAPPACAQ